jgi:uncharacterized protein
MQPVTHDEFAALDGHQYMNLTSFYPGGKGVTTPVWFAREGGLIYVITQPGSHKVQRIRATGRVQVGPADQIGTPLGPVVAAQAQVAEDAGTQAAGRRALEDKYGDDFRRIAAAVTDASARVILTIEAHGGDEA